MISAFIIITNILVAALTISFSAAFRFGKMLMNVEDNMEFCLDVIDNRYYNLVHMFDDTPGVIEDDPLVRGFLRETKDLRNDVLRIANLISRSTEQLNEYISVEKQTPALKEKSDAQSEEEFKE